MRKVVSFLSLLATGCGTCQEVALAPDERAWLGAYQEGAQITFRSNRGRIHTLTVLKPQEWHENTNCNVLEAGRYQPIFSQIVLRSVTPSDPQNPDVVVNIRKHNPEKAGYLSFNVFGLECSTSAQQGQPTSKLAQQPCTLATTGKTYPAAYVFRAGQNSTTYHNGRLQAFYWDKQDGLIRYELPDGEVFDRAERQP